MFQSPVFPQNFVKNFRFHARFSHLEVYMFRIRYNFASKTNNNEKNYFYGWRSHDTTKMTK